MDGGSVVSRRGVLVAASLGAFGLTGVLPLVREATETARALGPVPRVGARAVTATMRALADTIVPGPIGRGDPHPGAVEAGCVEELYDPFYGFSGSYPLVHADLQARTPVVLQRPATFDLALSYNDRERVLRDRLTAPPAGGTNPLYIAYYAVAVIVYVAYYGNARTDLGPRYIGFPVHSDGYVPRHSYYVTFAGMTRDGNPD